MIENLKREATVPSSILEKGVIYFFFRGCVNMDEPQGVEGIARSYIILRPLPNGAKPGEEPLEGAGDALQKASGIVFLVFVEKCGTSVKNLKELRRWKLLCYKDYWVSYPKVSFNV